MLIANLRYDHDAERRGRPSTPRVISLGVALKRPEYSGLKYVRDGADIVEVRSGERTTYRTPKGSPSINAAKSRVREIIAEHGLRAVLVAK